MVGPSGVRVKTTSTRNRPPFRQRALGPGAQASARAGRASSRRDDESGGEPEAVNADVSATLVRVPWMLK